MFNWFKLLFITGIAKLDAYLWKREYEKVMIQLLENCTNLWPNTPIEELVQIGFDRFYGNASAEDAAYYMQGVQ